MDQALIQIQENLDSIKSQSKKGTEFWSARALMKTLEYTTWAKFQDAIKRAKESCRRSGEAVEDHFAGSSKMVLTGSGAHRKIEDIYLTRYACYLIAQNGDPRKPQNPKTPKPHFNN
jgi:DNA-damage-inducible protein D